MRGWIDRFMNRWVGEELNGLMDDGWMMDG